MKKSFPILLFAIIFLSSTFSKAQTSDSTKFNVSVMFGVIFNSYNQGNTPNENLDYLHTYRDSSINSYPMISFRLEADLSDKWSIRNKTNFDEYISLELVTDYWLTESISLSFGVSHFSDQILESGKYYSEKYPDYYNSNYIYFTDEDRAFYGIDELYQDNSSLILSVTSIMLGSSYILKTTNFSSTFRMYSGIGILYGFNDDVLLHKIDSNERIKITNISEYKINPFIQPEVILKFRTKKHLNIIFEASSYFSYLSTDYSNVTNKWTYNNPEIKNINNPNHLLLRYSILVGLSYKW